MADRLHILLILFLGLFTETFMLRGTISFLNGLGSLDTYLAGPLKLPSNCPAVAVVESVSCLLASGMPYAKEQD